MFPLRGAKKASNKKAPPPQIGLSDNYSTDINGLSLFDRRSEIYIFFLLK